jgi:hypothetical protein
MNRWARWKPLAPYAALIGLTLLFAWRLAFTNGILARGDVLLYFYPYWEYRGEALAAGRLPWWNPLLFMGVPFLANSQAGVFYPPNWPLAWLAAPMAVKISVLAHLGLAAVGAYEFGRRALQMTHWPALAGASVFAFGGYLLAQIEHINQFQGLAWLPGLMLAAHGMATTVERGQRWRWAMLAGVVLALQLLAGHTQTAFISLAGAGVYAMVTAWGQAGTVRGNSKLRSALGAGTWLAGAAMLAAALAAAQLVPTLELSNQSLRGGGLALNEAVSFSLDPRLLGRALLPGYSRAMFSEFVGYLGVAGIALAALGMVRRPGRAGLVVVAALGLLFALGMYNPAYVGLAALPPFSFFRVPARWLALTAFGSAMLAGAGLEALATNTPSRRRVWLALAVPVMLAALTPLAARLTPAGETGPVGWPVWGDWVGWGLALVGTAALLLWRPAGLWRTRFLPGLVLIELFAAAQSLPFNHVSTPEAYTRVQPAMTQLLVGNENAGGPPPGRFLSMSGLRFDPGDLAELQGALASELGANGFFDFVVATKHKEVLSPNLPLAWGVPSVDGYDGGVLPLRHYADFTRLFTGAPSADGRLRENITTAPDPRLLALVNARYLVTDKVRDAWVDGVFYDLEFELVLADGEALTLAYVPRFQATALGVAANAFGGGVTVLAADGETLTLPISASLVQLPRPMTALSVTLTGPLTIRGLSLVDERSGAFQTLTLGPYRLVHSGDVKIYEHAAVLPRAFVVQEAVGADDERALELLGSATIDPGRTVILPPPPTLLAEQGHADGSAATILEYAPEVVRVRAIGPGYLVLTDAYYPGWRARVNGAATEILRADVMFRAVALPAGEHVVEFRYAPWWVWPALGVSGLAWAFVLSATWLARRMRG